MEKLQEALVKGVFSGDSVLLSGKVKKGSEEAPEEKHILLSLVHAPRVASSTKPQDEPYGWESRNYLRQQILGKVVKYTIDYKNNDFQYGQIFYDGKNINLDMLRNGYAKLGFLGKSNEAMGKTEFYAKAQNTEAEAKKQKLNIWSDQNTSETNTRKIVGINDNFDAAGFLKENKGQEVEAIVENVTNSAIYTLFIKGVNAYVKLNLRFVAIPSNKDQTLYRGGKAFAERLVLHKDVKVTLYSIDESTNTLIGDIVYDESKNLSTAVLKAGFSKLFTQGTASYTIEELNAAKEAQATAKSTRSRIWKNEVESENTRSASETKQDFSGVCMQAHSGDSISVKDNSTGQVERIFLGHIKAPNFAKQGTEDPDEPWAWQAKEYLRKTLVGEKVRCEFDYSKAMQKDNKQMNFYSVFKLDEKNGKEVNVNSDLLEQGYAKFVSVKATDQTSKYEDVYKINEKKAKDGKLKMFSTKAPGNLNYSDLTTANKIKKKEMISFLNNQKKLPCTVEYCYTSARYKLRIEKTRSMVLFSLLGITTFRKDPNNTDLHEKYLKLTLDFANNTILQRDCVCDITNADKMGNYFGYLYFKNVNFGTILLKEGLAIYNPNTITPVIYSNEYKNAEKEAQTNKKGIWAEEGVVNLLKDQDVSNVTSLPPKFEEKNEDVKLRITDYIDFNNFYVNFFPNNIIGKIENVLESYNSKKTKGIPLEKPIKLGTLCTARYNADDRYYRAKILNKTKDDKYRVEFIDYGTVDSVNAEDLIKIDSSIATFEPQAHLCELAYLRYSANSMRRALDKFPDFVNLDLVLPAKICYTYNTETATKTGVVIYQKTASDNSTTYHSDLLKIGYAKFDKRKKLPTYLSDLKEVEKKSETSGIGLWAENEASDYEDDNQNDD